MDYCDIAIIFDGEHVLEPWSLSPCSIHRYDQTRENQYDAYQTNCVITRQNIAFNLQQDTDNEDEDTEGENTGVEDMKRSK
jgi:hypothetical protein